MRTLHERGARWNRDKQPVASAVDVEIRSPSEAIESVRGTPGRRDFQQWLVAEAAGTSDVIDWIFDRAELVFPIAGVQEPAKGWEIRYETEDGRIAVFVAKAPEGTRVFDNSDPFGLVVRIHTQFDRFET